MEMQKKMPIIFIAVQCCQCSTMQVKQRSKSNKWTCAVCNQKQSVRQVFAQGPMARDLRAFVQSSNMSRQQHQPQPQPQPQPQDPQDNVAASDSPDYPRNKRRNDWSEYLEDVLGNDMKQDDEEGDGFEGQIVTELPTELFKKPKVNKHGSGSVTRQWGATQLHNHKPVFSNRNANKHVVTHDKEQTKYELMTITLDAAKSSDFVSQDKQEARTLQATKATVAGASKWSNYITEGDSDDGERLINRRKRADNAGQWSDEMYKTITTYEFETIAKDERVEDDIHPDFLQGSVISSLDAS